MDKTVPETEADELEEYGSKKTKHYWERWVKAAIKAAEPHWEITGKAWREYEFAEREQSAVLNNESPIGPRCYPIYWASCKVIEPAYYARTPKVVARRRFDIEDTEALVASIIAERLGEYLVDCCEFDSTMISAVQDFINGDKATTQLLYESDIEEQNVRTYLQPLEDGFLNLATKEIYDGEVQIDENGRPFFDEIKKVDVNKKIKIVPLCYNDILHTPYAKHEHQIKEQAYYFCLPYHEAEEKWGKETCKHINWKTNVQKKREDSTERDREEEQPLEKIVEGWEIHDLDSKQKIYFSEQFEEKIIAVEEDDWELREFFPSPKFIINSKPSKTLYPKPVYAYMEKQIDELHKCSKKVFSLIDGIRRRCLVDGASPELIHALNSLEQGEYVAVTDLNKFLQKGGIDKMMHWVPVQELVAAISELNSLTDKFKSEFFEWFGVPDILRGMTDPIETMGAQRIKHQAAHDRFKFAKKQVQQLARDSIEMMIDLALKKFTDEEIAEYIGLRFLSQEEQQAFPMALELLKNDTARMIRVDIETDSMTFVDEGIRAYHMQQAVDVMTAGMERIANMAQIDAAFGHVALQGLLKSLGALVPGKEFEMEVRQAANVLMEKLKNPPPPPPPPPDYEAQKLQLQAQKLMLENEQKQRELTMKDFETAAKIDKERTEMALEAQRVQLEELLSQWTIQVQTHEMTMNEYQMHINEFVAKNQALENQMEEVRLMRETDTSILQSLLSLQERTQAVQSELAEKPMILQLAMPKHRRKRGRVIFGEGDKFDIQMDEPETVESEVVEVEIDPRSGKPVTLPEVESEQSTIEFDEAGNAIVTVDEFMKNR